MRIGVERQYDNIGLGGMKMKRGIMPVITGIVGGVFGASLISYSDKKSFSKVEEKSIKMTEFYHVLERWLYIKQENRSLTEYFDRNGYKTVAIYGMKELGERLYDELKGTNVKVQYAIDKNAGQIVADIDVVTPQDALGQVDVIVVTPIHYFNDIESELSQVMDCPIVSIEDIIYELV